MKTVLFYITGHGLGHSTRIIEVINQLFTKAPEVLSLVNTSAPEWLFKQQVVADFRYIPCKNDIGAIQKDWRNVDKLETLRQYSEFIEKEVTFTKEQLHFVKQNNVAAIVSDIPAMAFVVAKKAGIPGFGITNFSWDWIYAPYAKEYPQYQFVVEHIRQCYCLADCLLRLPFYGDLSAFPVMEDIPLIATRSKMEKDNVIRYMNIGADKKIVLLYLGSFDYEKVLSDEILRKTNYHFMPPEMYTMSKLPFQALLKAADVVVTKPGYGIVSECIANKTPIMYTNREDFGEYHSLVKGIKKYTHNLFIPEEELLNGKWAEHLEYLLAAEYRWPEIAINGAEIAAAKILESI